MRSSVRGVLAGAAAGLGTVMDSEDIGAVLLGRRSEEPALHERFGGFLRRPQRRNVAASRVTVHKPNAAKATRNPTRTVACAASASTPIARAARTTPWAASPPRMPPNETRKKIPRAASDSADGFSLMRVRTAAATNPPPIGDAMESARLSIGRRREWGAARRARKRMLPPRQIRPRWSGVMRLVAPPRSGRKRTRVVTTPRRAVMCRWISMREPMSTWPNPADIVGRKPCTMYVLLSAYHATATPPAYARARRTSRIGHDVPRRTARPSAANAVEGSGRSANRIGNAGSAREADGTRERIRSAVVTNRTGRFGNRTRRITRTWDVIKTKNVYTIRRAKSGRASRAGRPIVTGMPTAATAAESPPGPSRLTSWKSKSATRYSRGRTSAVRKKSNSDAWAVTPAPRAYRRPKDRRPASGAAKTSIAAVGSASLTVVPRVTPKAKPDGRKIRINAR